MQRPYKYPYLTVLILGYYWLEHEGYYYKIRDWLGYKEEDELSFVMPLGPQALAKLSAVPGRQIVVLSRNAKEEPVETEVRKAAKKAKERKQSPVLFGSVDCSQFSDFCKEKGWAEYPQLTYIRDGAQLRTFSGPFLKPKILKFIKQAQLSSSP